MNGIAKRKVKLIDLSTERLAYALFDLCNLSIIIDRNDVKKGLFFTETRANDGNWRIKKFASPTLEEGRRPVVGRSHFAWWTSKMAARVRDTWESRCRVTDPPKNTRVRIDIDTNDFPSTNVNPSTSSADRSPTTNSTRALLTEDYAPSAFSSLVSTFSSDHVVRDSGFQTNPWYQRPTR